MSGIPKAVPPFARPFAVYSTSARSLAAIRCLSAVRPLSGRIVHSRTLFAMVVRKSSGLCNHTHRAILAARSGGPPVRLSDLDIDVRLGGRCKEGHGRPILHSCFPCEVG